MRLIDADALMAHLKARSDELMDEKEPLLSGACMGAAGFVMQAPTIDAVEVVHGEWIEWDEDNNTWECSNCAELYTIMEGNIRDNKYNYCPNCGAKMDKEVQP